MRYFFFFKKQNTFRTKLSTQHRFYLPHEYRNSCCVRRRTRYISELTLADCEWEGHFFKLQNVFFCWWKYYTLLSVGGKTVRVREGISSNNLNPLGVSWNILQYRGSEPIMKASGCTDFCSYFSAVAHRGQNTRFWPNYWRTISRFPWGTSGSAV